MEEMGKRIYQRLKELVSIRSVSWSEAENEASEHFRDFFSSLPYFKKNPHLYGLWEIPGDPFKRTVPYALILGNSKKTIISSGHMDVVSADSYGEDEDAAYDLDSDLEERLAAKSMSSEARKDLESGEWIWGRGVADMKGGHAIHLELFRHYAALAEEGKLPGSLLYVPVPDEESYSAGMREAVNLILKLKEEHGLDFRLLIDFEPTSASDGVQIMSIGSVGKIMPVVLVQGVPAHVGHCFNGLSPLGILSGIYDRTDSSLEFSDTYKGEATMPPTWTNFRDKKEIYDVSIPRRAAGYFTVLSFSTTPDEIIAKLKKISLEVFEEYVKNRDSTLQKYKKLGGFAEPERIEYKPCVYTFGELTEKLGKEKGETFEEFYAEAYDRIKNRIVSGELNYPDATMEMMTEVLDYSDMAEPLVLLGFAPPYYPPIHSDRLKGKEGVATEAFEFVKKISKRDWNQDVGFENYFMGISDLSYCGVDRPFDYEKFSSNAPMWGDLYNLNFESMEALGIPAIIYGPIGVGYHQFVERVNRKSLLEVVPSVTMKLIEYMWE